MELSVPLDLPALVDLLETEACLDCLDLLDLLDPEALLVLKEREEMQDQLGKKDLQVKNFNIFFIFTNMLFRSKWAPGTTWTSWCSRRER